MIRVKVINGLLIFIFLFLILGLLNLTIIQGWRYKNLSDKNCIRLLSQEGSRGRILDRQGNVIVGSVLSYDVMILPQEKEDELNQTLKKLGGILDKDFQELKNTFKNGYVAPFLPVAVAKNIEIKKALILEELKSDLNGVIVQPHPLRDYPYGKLASHVIGYLNEIDHWRLTKLQNYGYKTKDIVGFGGIEEKYDYYLRQEPGALSVEVDHQGRFMRILGFKQPKNGKDLQLTLDLKIQKIVEENLGDRNGSIIMLEPDDGAIIALVSSPAFNPSAFIKKSGSSVPNLFNNPDAPLINRAISSAYPAASVFKLVVATAALQTGKINLATTFFCPGSIHIGKREFFCWDTHNQQNLLGGITHSCDVFFYKTGLLLGAQLIHDYALKFGFAKPTGVDLPYETVGLVPDPLWKRINRFQNWFEGDTANFAVGQGDLLVTPIQLTRMMAVFANKGLLINPYIVKTVDGHDISFYHKKIARLPIKASTIEYIRLALRSVVTDPGGTANVLADLPVSVSGKTGTAQVSRGQPHGWFLGFFPSQNPKFVICVFLEHGGSGYAASLIAKKIIEAMIKEGLL